MNEVAEFAGEGGVDVTLPSIVDVFTGEELLSFGPGETAVAWKNVAHLLNGADYEPTDVQYDVYVRVGEELIGVLGAYGPELEDAIAAGAVRTDDSERAIAAFVGTDP